MPARAVDRRHNGATSSGPRTMPQLGPARCSTAHLATMRDGAPFGGIAARRARLQGRPHRVRRRDGARCRTNPKRSPRASNRSAASWITPGLVDCHTHLVFAGNRADEFDMRLNGATYEEIARAGGGIVSTVRKTRAAERRRTARAIAAARARAARRRRDDGRDQVRLRPRCWTAKRRCCASRVASATNSASRCSTTFLGAHALPRGIQRTPRRLHRRGVRAHAAGDRAREARRCGRCVLRAHRVHAGADPPRVRERRASTACGETARRSAQRSRRRGARGGIRRAVGRSSGIHRRRRRARDGRSRHGRRDVARRVLRAARNETAADRSYCASTACRWRWRATSIRARRRCCRCGTR